MRLGGFAGWLLSAWTASDCCQILLIFMEKQDFHFVAQIIGANPNQAVEIFDALKKEGGGWVAQAIEKHFGARHLTADERVMILILYFADGAIGKCVKTIEVCKTWADETRTRKVTLDDFCLFICPRLGFNF